MVVPRVGPAPLAIDLHHVLAADPHGRRARRHLELRRRPEPQDAADHVEPLVRPLDVIPRAPLALRIVLPAALRQEELEEDLAIRGPRAVAVTEGERADRGVRQEALRELHEIVLRRGESTEKQEHEKSESRRGGWPGSRGRASRCLQVAAGRDYADRAVATTLDVRAPIAGDGGVDPRAAYRNGAMSRRSRFAAIASIRSAMGNDCSPA